MDPNCLVDNNAFLPLQMWSQDLKKVAMATEFRQKFFAEKMPKETERGGQKDVNREWRKNVTTRFHAEIGQEQKLACKRRTNRL